MHTLEINPEDVINNKTNKHSTELAAAGLGFIFLFVHIISQSIRAQIT